MRMYAMAAPSTSGKIWRGFSSLGAKQKVKRSIKALTDVCGAQSPVLLDLFVNYVEGRICDRPKKIVEDFIKENGLNVITL